MTTKPENMNQIWAENGEKLNPDSLIPNKTSTGWTREIPPLTFFNWLQHEIGRKANYLNVIGVPEWSSDITYSEGSWARGSNGTVYYSFRDTTGVDPTTSPESWGPLLPDKNVGDVLISYDSVASLTSRGYLLQDGRAVSRTTYAELFALIGTRFGAGDGTTTFNVKNEKKSEESYVKAL